MYQYLLSSFSILLYYASENINGVLKDLLSSNILLQYVESENDIKVIERLQEKLEERKKILERKS